MDKRRTDKPIPSSYRAIDNDLARDNLEIHQPAADLEDLEDIENYDTPGANGEDF